MMQMPTVAEIDGVELRLLQSRRDVLKGFDRTGLAFRAAVKRQTPMVLVAVAAGLSTIWFTRRRGATRGSLPSGARSSASVARPSVLRTFLSGYAVQALANALQLVTTAWLKKRSATRPGTTTIRAAPAMTTTRERGVLSSP